MTVGLAPWVLFGRDSPLSRTILEIFQNLDWLPSMVIEGVPPGPRGPVLRWQQRRGWSLSGRPEGLVAMALDLGLPSVQVTDPSAPRFLQRLADWGRPAGLISGFHRLLPPTTLTQLGGALNFHPGRLPDRRGPAPLFWALRDGESELGWTIHRVDSGEDTGPVARSGSIAVEPGERMAGILERMARDAALDLRDALRDLIRGELLVHPQGSGARQPRPQFLDGRLDPGRPAVELHRFAAACAGVHPTYVEIANDRFFVADVLDCAPERTLPVEYALLGDRLILRCCPGVLELQLQKDGALFSGIE